MRGEKYGGLSVVSPQATAAFTEALRKFATDLTTNFASPVAAQPEDQLKAPVAALLQAAGAATGSTVVTRTETRIDGVAGRPDLGVDNSGLLVGSVELKAPGKGARPELFRDRHSKDQFKRFAKIPNLLYTDSREWALYHSGDLTRPVVSFSWNPCVDGPDAVSDKDGAALLELLAHFLRWEPIVPANAPALAEMLAPITRLLRDEVLADVQARGLMADMMREWQATLFPDADGPSFADGYAQTFTYALLLARLEGAPDPLEAATAATVLDDDHALLAQVLRVLAQDELRETIDLPVNLLERVIGSVDVEALHTQTDPWLYFYEHFLAAYDPVQRSNRGVYYTPHEVVSAQVRLSEQLLIRRFGKGKGFADKNVVVLDPATGTGTYPLTIATRTIKAEVEQGGEGVRAEVAARLMRNINAFELLVGPYAVSHLSLSRAFAASGAHLPEAGVNVFLTDALAAPTHKGFAKQATLFHRKLAAEQERASKVKDPKTHVTVCIGNPPYDRDESGTGKNVRRKGGMVRYNPEGDGPGLIQDFIDPLVEAGTAANAKTLYNDYIYFWRWAIWKICEQTADSGIVSFITASSYLNGPGFAGMREVMRKRFDELWFIDLGGEGRGARREENVFEGVMTPVVIAFAVRSDGSATSPDEGATVHYRRVSGTREEKLAALGTITQLDETDPAWTAVEGDLSSSFIPPGEGEFATWPLLEDLWPWRDTGTHFYRSWPVAESRDVLEARWRTLTAADPQDRAELLKETRDRKADKAYKDILTGEELRPITALETNDQPARVERIAWRSFDRQWCLADNRVGDYIRAQLWRAASDQQVYFQSLVQSPMSAGPALMAFPNVPDCHAFRGSYGDKGVFPLWRDAAATSPNITEGLLQTLERQIGTPISPEELAAYVYGILGTGAYTERFSDDLAIPGARVPLTADPALFAEVAALGRELLWWTTFGERFRPVDKSGNRVQRLPAGRVKNTKAVSAAPEEYPTGFSYEPETETLTVGEGTFAPVPQKVWDFNVSGLRVIHSWLGYRMKKRSGRKSSPLDDLRPESWTFSSELVEVLTVIEHLVEKEEVARDLLERVVESDLIESSTLPEPAEAERNPPRKPTQGEPGQAALFPDT